MQDDDTNPSFEAADEEHVRREKAKARELRHSAWWKNQLGKGQCYYCRRRVQVRELTMDHIVPVTRGGRSHKGNLVPCCKDCNSSKKYLLPVEWAAHLERLRRGTGTAPAGPPRE
jgi:5-methylcytosine-specific restriction endonuclease McrA